MIVSDDDGYDDGGCDDDGCDDVGCDDGGWDGFDGLTVDWIAPNSPSPGQMKRLSLLPFSPLPPPLLSSL